MEKKFGMDCIERSNIVSLELTLSTPGSCSSMSKESSSHETSKVKHEGFETGECSSNQEIMKPKPKTKVKVGDLSLGCSSRKRKCPENSIPVAVIPSWPSACKANRSKVEIKKRNRRIVLEDEVNSASREDHHHHHPWTIKKKLSGSDVGRLCRLTIGPNLVVSHIFPFLNADQLSKIREGLAVSIWDCDTNTQHGLNFKQWNKMTNGFIKNWSKNFVKRRELKAGDEIGLYWDNINSRFNFSVLNRASQNKPA